MGPELDVFFAHLFGRAPVREHGDLIEFRVLAPLWQSGKQKPQALFRTNAVSVREAVTQLTQRTSPRDIYFGVLPRTIPKGTKEAIKGGATLWVDIDEKKVGSLSSAYKHLEEGSNRFGYHPNCIVHSGAGLHGYWFLDARIDNSSIESLNGTLGGFCDADRVYDVSRVLRVPGTMNVKREGDFRMTKIAYIDDKVHSAVAMRNEHIDARLNEKPKESGPSVKEGFQEGRVPFSFDSLPRLWQGYVKRGLEADCHGYYQGDRSRLDFAVMKELLKAGADKLSIERIFLDPANAISAKTLEKHGRARESYLEHTINKAMCFLGGL